MNKPSKQLLVKYYENDQESRFILKRGSNIIGSSPEADIVITNPWISGMHAQIIFWPMNFGDYCTIVDLNSRNGTYVNQIMTLKSERAIYDPCFLNNDDVITFHPNLDFPRMLFIDGEKEDHKEKPAKIYPPNTYQANYSLAADDSFNSAKESSPSLQSQLPPNSGERKQSAQYNSKLNISSNESDSKFELKRILNFPLDKLLYLIHRSPIFRAHPKKQIGINIDPRLQEVAVNGDLVDPPLTKLEFNVLSYMYSRNGEVCTKDDFAVNISGWNERSMNNQAEDAVGDPEIYQVISRIRRKIGRELIRTVSRRGYRLINT